MKRESHNEWSGRTRGGIAGYSIFVFIIKKLGLTAAYTLLFFVALYFIPFSPQSTKSVWYYSRTILKKGWFSSLLFIYKNYYNLGLSLIDKTAVSAGLSDRFKFVFDEPLSVKSILSDSVGAIIIGAHFGNWEVGAPYFDKYKKRMKVVMMDLEYRQIKALLSREKSVNSFEAIPISDNSFEHIFKIREALKRGEYVAMQGDRLTPNGKRVAVNFLGHDAYFPLGPFVLASKLEAPVIFYFAIRVGIKRYKFVFRSVDMGSLKGDREDANYLLKEYISLLEKYVMQSPEQWYNFYKFWL